MERHSFITIASLLMFSGASFANVKPIDKPGWALSLNLNGGYVWSKSALSTSDDNETLVSLDQPDDATEASIIYPLGRLQYTSRNGRNQIYIGNTSEQISNAQFQYELGYVRQFNQAGRMTLAYFPQLPLFNTSWEDPYLVGTAREETDEDSSGGRIAWEYPFGAPFTLKYAFAALDIDDEMSGVSQGLTTSELELLERDSLVHRGEIETFFPVAKGWFLRPALQGTFRLADGDAVSFSEYTAKLGVLRFAKPHTFILSLDTGIKENDASNPVFDETVEETSYSAFLIYDYANFLGMANTSLNLIGGYSNSDANVDFFDSEALIASAGITFRF